MSSPFKLWDGVVRRLEAEIPAFTFDAWVRPLIAEKNESGLRLICPTPFHRDRIRERFLDRITELATAEAGRAVEIEFTIGEAGAPVVPIREETAANPNVAPAPPIAKQKSAPRAAQ